MTPDPELLALMATEREQSVYLPTPDEIAQMRAEIDAEHVAAGRLPGVGGYFKRPESVELSPCTYYGPGSRYW